MLSAMKRKVELSMCIIKVILLVPSTKKKREGERERERVSVSQTDRQTDRQTRSRLVI